jgi:pyridoxamine 5'-phosphate oxidase
MSIASLRKDYQLASLAESDVAHDPITQFAHWFEQALKAEVAETNAMSLSTVNADGKPSSRIVLIKEFDARGFTWFTNYDSRKGQELADNPHAALLFFWIPLERQVRIEGRIEKISDSENDHYFNSRPLGSRQSALASQQSQPIANRQQLEDRLAQVVDEFGEHPPRPEHWGGYRLIPEFIEFWQGRSSRLHDRIAYTRQTDGTWVISRLQP